MYEVALFSSVIIAIIVGSVAWFMMKNKCIERLRKVGAVSPETAVKPEVAGISGFTKEFLQIQSVLGIIKSTPDGRYYTEE